MLICPYKEMKYLRSLPCTREKQGFWIYCSFCGQKMRPEMLFSPVDSLMSFLVFAIILMLVANSLSNSLRTPNASDTFERINSGPADR
ncbi:hypothetical protein [Oscillatoria acuminata]|uniref:Uncharacterized protein n=1 Tax=Oscillatoria acuminata PCC 6304 TaxID=56110 RepID=K9TJX5_9CYAN|nr:hypothetical protein [Oscillatoria acuminata]AFY82708.1 hypothetical protein Oscil6304_3126 [Oscillatoria acuminata PCC 6304]